MPEGGDYLAGFPRVCEVQDITLLSAGVGTAGFGAGHQWLDALKLFDVRAVVTRSDNTFLIHVYDVIAHHLPSTDFAKRSERLANKVYIFSSTSHSAKISIFLRINELRPKSHMEVGLSGRRL